MTYRIPADTVEALRSLEAEITRGEDLMAAMLRTVSEGN